MELQFKFDNKALKELLENMDAVYFDIDEVEAKGAIKEICEVVKAKSVSYSPVEEGWLEKAHHYRVRKVGGETVGFIYLDDNSKSALYQGWIHEGIYKLGKLSRAKGPNVGRKFLERAMRDSQDAFLAIIQRRLAKYRR